MSINVTVVIEIAEPLRRLLADLVGAVRVAPPAAPAGTKVPAERGAHPDGSVRMDVSLEKSPVAASPPPALSSPGGARRAYETPERVAYLTKAWRDGVSRAEALREMNAMAGPAVPAETTVSLMVKRLDLQRSPEARRKLELAKVEAMRAARTKVAAPAVSQAAPPVSQAAAHASHVPPRSYATIVADTATILAWGAEHGCRQQKLDLPAMNARRRQLGLAPFELPPRGRAA